MLLEDAELRVAASAGEDAAPHRGAAGSRRGVAGWVATRREPVLIEVDLIRLLTERGATAARDDATATRG